MRLKIWAGAGMTAALAAVSIGIPAALGAGHGPRSQQRHLAHVLLISVDGLHQSDLAWYVRAHPRSELAMLTGNGREYANARTPIPSDSFPGLIAQTTGGNPRTAGIYYDDEYSHGLLAPGTTSCQRGAPLGTQVIYDSPIDKDPTRLDAGQGLSGLPGSILRMTPNPKRLLETSGMPVNPKTCQPVFPHAYLQVNTVFNVARDHGLRTAWSDKHPAYEILNGPSGTGVQDLFTPEIDSNALMPNGNPYPGGGSWTDDNAATMQYDSYKVQAIINEIDGFDHSRRNHVGVPAIFGMNFQTVSTAEKLLTSDGLTGGYEPGTTTPGPLLRRALDYINAKLAAIVVECQREGISGSTALIVSAKHGQSPQDPNALTRIDDGLIISAINSGWQGTHPSNPSLVTFATDDDAIQMWLSDRSQAAASYVKQYLLSHPATGNTVSGGLRTLQHSGLQTVFAGTEAAQYFGVPVGDPRHPDVWGVVQHGVVYTGGHKKIAEHGGANEEDRHVPILVYAPGVVPSGGVDKLVETTQIAPTILQLLGLNPSSLQAVKKEGTPILPGI